MPTKNLALVTHPGVWITLSIVLILGWTGQSDYEAELQETQLYCAMVEKHRATNGEFGWPDENGKYDRFCVR